MSQTAGTEAESRLQPPYVSFQSIKTALAQFKEHETPDRIDRSVLTNFSGAVGSQILTALRFLGLTDHDGRPTVQMKKLVAAYGADDWPSELEAVLEDAYAPIFELSLATCSPSQFIEKFKGTYKGAEDVIRKSMTFFLNAASDAQIPVSSFIMKARKPRGPSTKRRPRSSEPRPSKAEEKSPPPPPPPPPSPSEPSQFLDRLMEKFPALDPAWPDDVKAKWFDAFKDLMEKADQK